MKLKVLVALACSIALAGVGRDARSEIQPAMAGHGWPNHADGCFGSSWALMRNNCGPEQGLQRGLVIPMQIHAVGWYYTVIARAAGNGFNAGTQCQAIQVQGANNPTQILYNFTSLVSTNTTSNLHNLALGSMWVQYTSTVHFECNVAHSGGRVQNVEMY
jgi:hypothetical protein